MSGRLLISRKKLLYSGQFELCMTDLSIMSPLKSLNWILFSLKTTSHLCIKVWSAASSSKNALSYTTKTLVFLHLSRWLFAIFYLFLNSTKYFTFSILRSSPFLFYYQHHHPLHYPSLLSPSALHDFSSCILKRLTLTTTVSKGHGNEYQGSEDGFSFK